MTSVVVVGGGVGGLAAAARLAAAGHQVTLCERNDAVGGKLGVAERTTPSGTFRFDTGPTLLTLPDVFRDLFAATGVPMEDLVDLFPLEPTIRYRFPDGTRLDASSDLDTMCGRLDRVCGEPAGDEWRALMQRAGKVWEATHESVLTSSVAGARTLLRRSVRLGDVAAVAPGRTLRQVGTRQLTDPRLRMMLDRYATYAGSDPRRAPAAFVTIPYVEQTFGGWFVAGGLGRLAEALVERIQARGGRVRTGADVRSIHVSGDKVSGVRLLGGEFVGAEVVVADVDARHLYTDLVPRRTMQRRLSRAPLSMAGFVVLLGIRGRTPGVAQHNVFFSGDYDAEFDAIFGSRPRPVSDPTIYVNVVRDRACAPADHEAWLVLVNAPVHGPVDWDSEALSISYAARLTGTLARLGLQTAGRVVHQEIITPADLARTTRSPGGAIYGPSSNTLRSAFLRPPNATGVRGLYHVGGSTHPGGGLPLVAMSARIVADLIGPA